MNVIRSDTGGLTVEQFFTERRNANPINSERWKPGWISILAKLIGRETQFSNTVFKSWTKFTSISHFYHTLHCRQPFFWFNAATSKSTLDCNLRPHSPALWIFPILEILKLRRNLISIRGLQRDGTKLFTALVTAIDTLNGSRSQPLMHSCRFECRSQVWILVHRRTTSIYADTRHEMNLRVHVDMKNITRQ